MAINNLESTVFVVDDDSGYRSILTKLLSTNGFVVKACESAEEFLECKTRSRPGCLLLDVHMPGMSGLELQEKLKSSGIMIPVVFMSSHSGHSGVPDAVKAMKNNAVDFLCKPIDTEELITVINIAIEKDRLAAQDEDLQNNYHGLSDSEKEVMFFVSSGLTNKETAEKTGLADKTVKYFRSRLMKTLGVSSFLDLVRAAVRLGIVKLEDI